MTPLGGIGVITAIVVALAVVGVVDWWIVPVVVVVGLVAVAVRAIVGGRSRR